MSVEVTLKTLSDKVRQLRSLGPEAIDHVVERWSQGRHLNMALDEVKPLLLRRDEVARKVDEAVSKLKKLLTSPYGGVEIYSIRSPQRTYGTGKSQLAAFIARELTRRGFPARYLTVDVETVESSEFRKTLWEVGEREKVQAIFVDEVDVLVSPELGDERQARVLETFANVVIGYSEHMSAREDYKQAIILVLSYKAEEEINRIAWQRLGRRVVNTLVSADISLTRADAYEIFEITAALAAVRERLGEEAIHPLMRFVKDFAKHLWSDSELATLPLGAAISSATNLSKIFASSLKRLKPEDALGIIKIVDNETERGRRAEDAVKRVLSRVAPRFEFSYELAGTVHAVSCLLDNRRIAISGHPADTSYLVRIGTLDVGRCLVEVTAEKKLSARKRRQLSEFSAHYPTLLVHLYDEEEDKEVIESEVESISGGYSIGVVPIPLHLVKYPAALGSLGEELCYEIAKEKRFHEAVRAILHKYSLAIVNQWFAKEMAEKAKEATTRAEAVELSKDALRRAVRAALNSINMPGASKGRMIETISKALGRSISETLSGMLPKLDESIIQQAVNDIIVSWAKEGLGRRTDKYFFKSNWSDEKAEEVALAALDPYIDNLFSK